MQVDTSAVVDLITKGGGFGLVVYMSVRLVPHVISFLDEQRKAMQEIAKSIVESKVVIHDIKSKVDNVVTQYSDTDKQFSSLRELIIKQVAETRESVLNDLKETRHHLRDAISTAQGNIMLEIKDKNCDDREHDNLNHS